MSSDHAPGLCNLDYATRYEEVLAQNLPASFVKFSEFFAGTQRLNTLAAMLSRHFSGDGRNVLNIGSGPFATEIFVEALQNQTITAIDYTPEFAPFHGLFQQEGHLKTTRFEQADAMALTYKPASFDLIILHDLLYETGLDLEALVTRVQPLLKPGGLLFLDFVNSRTRWIWAALGKPDQFRRYDPRRVRRYFHEAGVDVVDWRPTHGSKSRAVRSLHWILWHFFRASNNYAVLVRKKAAQT